MTRPFGCKYAWLVAAYSGLVLAGCTTGGNDSENEPSPPFADDADSPPPAVPTHRDVADAAFSLTADSVETAVKAIEKHVEKVGGLVAEQESSSRVKHHVDYTAMKVKVPAAKATVFVQWLSAGFNVVHSRLRFAAREGAANGGSGKDMVTIDIQIDETWVDRGREAWVRVGARSVGAIASYRAAAGAPAAPPASYRHGTGIVVMAPDSEAVNLAVDVFDRTTEIQQPVLVTVGGSGYSTYLGSGHRDWLNPTLGMHAGYASFNDIGSFVLDGEVGLELVRWHEFLLHTFGRGMVLINKNGSVLGREYGIQLCVPF